MSAQAHHPFIGCQNRLMHQVDRLADFLGIFDSLVNAPEDRAVAQFTLEMVAVAAHAFADEYFRCLLLVATWRRERAARDFLAREGAPHEIGALDSGCNLGVVVSMMQSRVRFARKRGKTLRRTFEVLLEFDAFPDDESANLLAKLAKVRHVVVHEGGWPGEEHAKDIQEPDVIVMTNSIEAGGEGERDEHRFYRLDLVNDFIPRTLAALQRTAMYHENAIRGHKRWAP